MPPNRPPKPNGPKGPKSPIERAGPDGTEQVSFTTDDHPIEGDATKTEVANLVKEAAHIINRLLEDRGIMMTLGVAVEEGKEVGETDNCHIVGSILRVKESKIITLGKP